MAASRAAEVSHDCNVEGWLAARACGNGDRGPALPWHPVRELVRLDPLHLGMQVGDGVDVAALVGLIGSHDEGDVGFEAGSEPSMRATTG